MCSTLATMWKVCKDWQLGILAGCVLAAKSTSTLVFTLPFEIAFSSVMAAQLRGFGAGTA